jgi:glycosyltransferase involved in cell wall biosynthesis
VAQTYKNLEIILVDDGSPDNCGAMCDAWATKDQRIKVIHQENAGGGYARNVGFDIATGDFIGLVDSDDYLSPLMYERLMHFVSADIDIVECEMVKTEGDYAPFSVSEKVQSDVYTVSEAIKQHICDKLFRQTPPNKLYRRSVVEDVRFPSGTGIDDEYWTYRVIGNSRKLIHIPDVLYAYRQHPCSVMHSLTIPKRLRAIDAKMQRYTYICTYFPEHMALCAKELCMNCIYQGQFIQRSFSVKESAEAMVYLTTVIRQYPIRPCMLKERIWLTLAKVSFSGTCRLRNLLGIGL